MAPPPPALLLLLLYLTPFASAAPTAVHDGLNASSSSSSALRGRRADASSVDADRSCAVGLHADCFESGCCADKELACFKRTAIAAAQCLPRQPHCVDTAEWLCPGWELCAKRMGDCQLSRCCQSTEDECYQKDGEYAECRQKGTCVGKKDPISNIPWLCSVMHAPTSCTFDWQECTSSKCCVNPGFTCREKI